MERRKACEDELKALEEEHERVPFLKTTGMGKTFLSINNLQFFAKKKEEEEEEDEKPKPKRKPKSKSEEEAPAWAQKLIDLVTPKVEEQQGTQKVPVPPKPKVEEDEEPEVEEVEETDKPKKQGFLSWFL
ncbi:hypothetical protein [Priestia megaterium]|uniref:hypothetical protein n=1 Tax=Priestia megaterium TaxID=1404 RepID=UPI002E21F38E|nr:hypothetical protein [Priestia megaterium]